MYVWAVVLKFVQNRELVLVLGLERYWVACGEGSMILEDNKINKIINIKYRYTVVNHLN